MIPDVRRGRWAHFKARAVRPVAIVVPLVVFVVVTLGSDVIGGLGWALIAYAVFLVRAAWSAFRGEADAFYESYAEHRDLELTHDETPLVFTPLFAQGDLRYIDHLMVGTLPGDLPGFIALYTFEDHTHTSGGEVRAKRYEFTIVVHELTSASPRLTELYCLPRLGRRFTDPIRDRKTDLKRLELESEVLDRRYELFHSPGDDEVWMRRVFVPSFITWVESDPPRDFHFEVSGIYLSAFVRGHCRSAAELDALCQAAAGVAHRVEGESAESMAAGAAPEGVG